MSRYLQKHDSASIERRIKAGEGQGEGPTFKPWLTVRSLPSRGRSAREKGWTTGRVHHFHSEGEYQYFLNLEWSLRVIDIREQFPLLPRERTVSIAESREIAHPIVPGTTEPVVMTSDFRITLRIDSELLDIVRTFKREADLQSDTVITKLEIERRFWEEQGIS